MGTHWPSPMTKWALNSGYSCLHWRCLPCFPITPGKWSVATTAMDASVSSMRNLWKNITNLPILSCQVVHFPGNCLFATSYYLYILLQPYYGALFIPPSTDTTGIVYPLQPLKTNLICISFLLLLWKLSRFALHWDVNQAIDSICDIWKFLDSSSHSASSHSKASRRHRRRRVAVKRARSPNPGWRSWSTTSMFPRTRSRRPARHPWTRLMLDFCSSSSCSSSCRSSASSSSTTTTRLSCQHHSSMHLYQEVNCFLLLLGFFWGLSLHSFMFWGSSPLLFVL